MLIEYCDPVRTTYGQKGPSENHEGYTYTGRQTDMLIEYCDPVRTTVIEI